MLSDLDKDILNILQTGLSLEQRLFCRIAQKLGITEEKLFERLRQLKAEEYIRKIGVLKNSEKLAYISTLVALQVEPGCCGSIK